MTGLLSPDNPIAAPNSDNFTTEKPTSVLIAFSLFCGWITVLTVIGYALLGVIANGYEMAFEFSAWRLREEVFLGVLLAFGAFLGSLMRRAHQNHSTKRCIYVGVLSFPALAYIVLSNLS